MTPHPEEKLTLPQIFFDRAGKYGERPALYWKNKQLNRFLPILWTDWAEAVRYTALGLKQLGISANDRVALLSENRPEWTFVDLGTLSIGATLVPIYPTSSYDDVLYLIQNSQAKILVLSAPEHYARLAQVVADCPQLEKIIVFDRVKLNAKGLEFSNLLEIGKREMLNNPEYFEQLVNRGNPSDIATIIYTSGTTGPPKGVMLTHHNFISNYLGAQHGIKLSDKDSALSFLPLCHVFERLAGYYFMMFHGATISYAENMQTVPQDIKEIRPTVCAAVPRFYEKVYAKILEKVQSGPPMKKRIFDWAIKAGQKKAEAVRKKTRMSFSEKIAYALAKILVFNKIRRGMGGRIRFFISGGAPLSKELAEFFFAADILILEGYGLTETSPVIAVNTPESFRFGTVGKPLPNVEVKIAEDGEILTKGPCVMQGYYRNPEATAEVLQDGWFHTGDIGTLEEGFLKITDRKKDIIATSGGKKISPQNIENRIISDPLFSQVIIVGDKRNYLVALVVPNRMRVEEQAAKLGIAENNYESLLKNRKIVEWINQCFRTKTEGLASYEQIKYIALLPKEMTQDSGELTPTLKFKRKLIMDKYKDIIEEMYQRKPESIETL